MNTLDVGVRGKATSDSRPSLLAATSFSSAAGTDVPGQDLRVGGGRGTGAGTPGDIDFQTGTVLGSGTTAQSFTSRWRVKATTGDLDAATGAELIRWGATSSFPALKRSSAELQVRLADDSAYAQVDALGYSAGGAAGASGTFTTADAKTVTVTNGIITSIV
jgi:hypothetical protein